MESVQILHLGCVSSVFLASKQGPDQDQKVVKAYHKGHLQVRHYLNITREVTNLRHLKDLGVPGVVELCGTADDATNVYLVFEPCSGGDLYKRLAHKGLFDEGQLCKEVVTPLLKVLHSLHQVGIIHRDIKPENIFFETDGTLRLGDFGLAINATRERPISKVGTLDYMAPEVLAQPSADVIALRKIRPTQLPSYDCKVDIWALGVLVYEALIGVTPFNDADPQAASLKAQFRPPLPLPPGISTECADFVTQALSKQASNRPSALQLLRHPWVKVHVPELDMARRGIPVPMQRASSGSMLGSASAADQHAACSTSGHSVSCSSNMQKPCELSTSAPAGSLTVLDAACRFAAGQPCVDARVPQLVVQKPQPKQTAPQQLPPHPFAAAAMQYSVSVRTLSGPLMDTRGSEDITPVAGCCAGDQQDGAKRVHEPPSLLIPAQRAQQQGSSDCSGRFPRQLSSPAQLRGCVQPPQEVLSSRASSDLPPSSPLPPSSSGARLSALAMSPVRALWGAGRNLVRSRSGAGAPAADGSTAVHSSRDTNNQPVSASFLIRSPLPSPIKGLLQPGRRRPAQAASTSLFAAAQWKPPGAAAAPPRHGSSAGSGGSSWGVRFSGTGSNSSSNSGSCARGLDTASMMRTCSMGPNVVLGAGLCSHGSNSTSGLPAEAGCSSSSSAGCSGSSHTAAAVAAVGPHARQLPALGGHGPSGGRSDEQQAYTRGKQQLALLNRYPSAPDPGPLLALSPVRSVGSKSTGMPPLALPPTDKQSVVRGAWLKVQGVCRKVSKQCSRESVECQPQDSNCLSASSP